MRLLFLVSKSVPAQEYYWHLRLGSDKEDQWDTSARSYEWIPGEQCKGMKSLNPEDLVRTLVEDGGWYLVGGESII